MSQWLEIAWTEQFDCASFTEFNNVLRGLVLCPFYGVKWPRTHSAVNLSLLAQSHGEFSTLNIYNFHSRLIPATMPSQQPSPAFFPCWQRYASSSAESQILTFPDILSLRLVYWPNLDQWNQRNSQLRAEEKDFPQYSKSSTGEETPLCLHWDYVHEDAKSAI